LKHVEWVGGAARPRQWVPLAFADIDGTVNDDSAPEAERLATVGPARAVVGELEALGIPVVLVTSRAPGETWRYRLALGASGPVLCEEGAVLLLPDEPPWTRLRPETPDYRVVARPEGTALVLGAVGAEEIAAFLRHLGAPEDGFGHAVAEGCERLASAFVPGLEPALCARAAELGPDWGVRVSLAYPPHLISADADKGRGLRLLAGLAAPLFGAESVLPLVFANDKNDLPLYEQAHRMGGLGVLVADPSGAHRVEAHQLPPTTLRTRAAGGEGMREALPELLRFVRAHGLGAGDR
jgi:hypothetical protein